MSDLRNRGMDSGEEKLSGVMAMLLDRGEGMRAAEGTRIPWSSPVLCFGDVEKACVATLGLNPSNREFVDVAGNELTGVERRFHTLESLGLESWLDADTRHIDLILEACRSYFVTNPYELWFRKLDQVLTGVNASYFDPTNMACHLDLVPYATRKKWSELSTDVMATLVASCGDVLGLVLRASAVRLLILNGMSVVRGFQEFTGCVLETRRIPAWTLRRRTRSDVVGVAFSGIVDNIGGVSLDREIVVLGFNHNLQGSFGVSSDVIRAIRAWIAKEWRRESCL